MRSGPRTFPFDWHAWLGGTKGMNADLIAAYIQLTCLIYAHDGEVERDDVHLAGLIGVRPSKAQRLTDRLIKEGKIFVTVDGTLSNDRAAAWCEKYRRGKYARTEGLRRAHEARRRERGEE